jgi:hypothetical protein
MLKSLLRRDAVAGVVDKYLLKEVLKLSHEWVRCRYDVLESVSCFLLGMKPRESPTLSFFMALTNRLDARVVSWVG